MSDQAPRGTGIIAAVPDPERSSSQIVHLYLPGYRAGRVPRAPDSRGFEHSMCNVETVNERTPDTNPVDPGGLRKHRHHTVSEARNIIAAGGYLRWCRMCVGRAAEECNALGVVIGIIIDRQVGHDG